MNPEAINLLIDSNRYNIEILSQLENYVQYQVDKQTYHLEANLTVLKFYQFHPEKLQKFIVGKILIKALMNLPSTDFTLCMYLIAERHHTEEPIKILTTLAQLLESAQFADFWVETNTCRELLNTIAGFDDSIRGNIINLLTQTYHTISKDTLSEFLSMKGADLDALINARGWKQTEDSVTFPTLDEVTQKTKKKIADTTKSEDLSRILTCLKL